MGDTRNQSTEFSLSKTIFYGKLKIETGCAIFRLENKMVMKIDKIISFFRVQSGVNLEQNTL